MALMVGCPKKTPPAEPQEDLEAAERERARIEAEERARAAEQAITPIQPEETEEIVLEAIHFDYDKYNLTPQATTILARNAEIMMNNPSIEVVIEGHCDERGTEEYNLALGEKRAIAARDFLVRFGIAKSRVSVISYGEERPLDLGSNEEAWAKNRRAESVIR
jgi:peptidoglycan-associated lipoprotein